METALKEISPQPPYRLGFDVRAIDEDHFGLRPLILSHLSRNVSDVIASGWPK